MIELDVEGLAHVGAAVAQDLHHFDPILHRVEMRLHRLRLRRHLAQSQRSREDLDEDGFHLGNVSRRARSIPRRRLVVLLLVDRLTIVALPVMGRVVSAPAVIRRQRLAVLRRDLH